MKQAIFYSVFIIALLFVACNKKDNNISKTALLPSGTWKLTAAVSDNDANLVIWSDTWDVLVLTNTTLKWMEAYPGGRSGLVTFTKL